VYLERTAVHRKVIKGKIIKNKVRRTGIFQSIMDVQDRNHGVPSP